MSMRKREREGGEEYDRFSSRYNISFFMYFFYEVNKSKKWSSIFGTIKIIDRISTAES